MPIPPATPSLFHSSLNSGSEWITAHCDGGARGNPGPAGYGALVQDHTGAVLAELSEFLGIRTNNYAEYSGLLASLQYALDHNYARLRVVSDSELMVKQIQGKYKVNSPDLRPLWQEARNRIAKLEAFEISHALRHKNKAADRLANEAMDRGMKRNSGSASASAPLKASSNPQQLEASANLPPKAPQMLRGFTKDGVVHILGSATLPDGVFVKITPE
jgi:ribonuclease HI